MCTRLATRNIGFEHEHVETFGRGVHRRRQPAWTGTDDHQIAHQRVIERFIETKFRRDLAVRRIAHDRIARTDDHRHVCVRHLEVIEQRLDLLVAVEIHVGVRVPVAREEVLDFECPREMVGADEEDVAGLAREQHGAPQQKRAHEDLAQLAVGLHHREQILPQHFDELGIRRRANVHERGTARQQAHFSCEFAGLMGHDDHVAGPRRLHHFQRARPQREERRGSAGRCR